MSYAVGFRPLPRTGPMRISTRAALLSAFVCPGAGQVYLKRHAVGAVLLLVSAIALAALLVPAVAAANAIAERILSGELAADAGLLGEVRTASAEASASAMPATVALLVAWVVGIVHAWHVGRRRDLQ